MRIINLTEHPATSEQIALGVVDQAGTATLMTLLTFAQKPRRQEIFSRAEAIATLAAGYSSALVGGAPWLVSALEAALLSRGVRPIHAPLLDEGRVVLSIAGGGGCHKP